MAVGGRLEDFADSLGASEARAILFSGFFSNVFEVCSSGRPLPLGVVGVLGTAGDFMGDLIGDFFGATDALVVVIGVGRLVGLLAAGCSPAVAIGFKVPLLLPFEPVLASAAFLGTAFESTFFTTSFGGSGIFFSSAVFGVSASGIECSSTVSLFLLLYCELVDSFRSRVGRDSSSTLKLVLLFDTLGSLLSGLLNWSPIWPLFSTVTKLVRILERGRGDVPLLAIPLTVQ